jgi:hypothetical protein
MAIFTRILFKALEDEETPPSVVHAILNHACHFKMFTSRLGTLPGVHVLMPSFLYHMDTLTAHLDKITANANTHHFPSSSTAKTHIVLKSMLQLLMAMLSLPASFPDYPHIPRYYARLAWLRQEGATTSSSSSSSSVSSFVAKHNPLADEHAGVWKSIYRAPACIFHGSTKEEPTGYDMPLVSGRE